MRSKLVFLSGVVAVSVGMQTAAFAQTRFSGGVCASQGNWIQSALQQADTITTAINALRHDPNCQALVKALEQSPQLGSDAQQMATPDTAQTSFANFYRELSALSDYMKPDRVAPGADPTMFKNIVYNVAFNKSFEAIKDLSGMPEAANLDAAQQGSALDVGNRLRDFMKKSKQIANVTMATSRNILAALPSSKMCLHNRPSESVAIFSAIVGAGAALVTGGEINNVGSFLASIINYKHEMSYVNQLAPMEMERFNASISCLVESTSESYCGLQDAEDALNFFKSVDENGDKINLSLAVIENKEQDPLQNSMGGLLILLRDVPVIQSWMQKVLFGIDPRILLEAKMKNTDWASYISFVTSVNTLQAGFREKERDYQLGGSQRSVEARLAHIRGIIGFIYENAFNSDGGGTNFYIKTINPDNLPFFLLGLERAPSEYNPQTNGFDSIWNKWAREGTYGTNDPDKLLDTVRLQLWTLIEKARYEANTFFSGRMIVDPQNLVAEAMKGPGTSPYKALINVRTYFKNLNLKLTSSIQSLSEKPEQRTRRIQLQAQIPLIKDSIARLDEMITALESVSDIPSDSDREAMLFAHRKVMDVIYEFANMLVSRDSFIGNRMQTLLQADVSDTLWRQTELTGRQSQLLSSLGADIVSRLSFYFSNDPVLQRADISQAKILQQQNLKSVEGLFSKVLFNQILKLDCGIYGGNYCLYSKTEMDPTKASGGVTEMNKFLASPQLTNGGGWFSGFVRRQAASDFLPTEDSQAHRYLRAKLCVQALAFESREQFKEICKDAVLISEFSDETDKKGLNLAFSQKLSDIKTLMSSQSTGRIDGSRSQGVCAFRSYLRKNHIFRMYQEYRARETF